MTTVTTASLNILPLTVTTAAGTYTTGFFDVRHFDELLVSLLVPAFTGTGTLNVFIDTTVDETLNGWQLAQLGPVGIAAAPANNPYPSTYVKTISAYQATSGAFGDFLRIRWIVTGSPISISLAVLAIGKGK
jgi:hypothetical protein